MVVQRYMTLPSWRTRPLVMALIVASTYLSWLAVGLPARAQTGPANKRATDSTPKTDPATVTRATFQAPLSTGAEVPVGAVSAQLDHAISAKIFRYSQRLIQRSDSDGDGRLNRREWGRVWGFLMTDANGDGAVDLDELVRRVAAYGRNRKIRLIDPLADMAESVPPLLNPTTDSDAGRAANGEPRPANGTERPEEDPSAPDASQSEPRRHDSKFYVSRSRLPEGLPGWFLSRDADGDGQLTMAEYAPKATRTALAEFAHYDANGDGVITANECVRAARSVGEKKSP